MKKVLILNLCILCSFGKAFTQVEVLRLSPEMMKKEGNISLGNEKGWLYHTGHHPDWSNKKLDIVKTFRKSDKHRESFQHYNPNYQFLSN